MIPARSAERAITLAQSGWTVSAIAERLGHDRKTIRVYVNGHRAPGQQRHDVESFAPFTGYSARRTRDDPHLPASGLHRELAGLGYPGSYSALTRALRTNGISTNCIPCHQKPSYVPSPRPAGLPWRRRQGLPIRVAPVTGETIASYLARLAAGNHLPVSVLRAHLPAWFTARVFTHDDLAGAAHTETTHAEHLAALTGLGASTLLRALPAFGHHADCGRPLARATHACRRCAARHGHTDPIPVHLPAHQRLCVRHRIWLGHTAQIDLAATPEVIHSHRYAVHLAHRYGTSNLMLAEVTARQQITDTGEDEELNSPVQRRITVLAPSDQPQAADHPDLIEAATYPATISNAAQALDRSRRPQAMAEPPIGPD